MAKRTLTKTVPKFVQILEVQWTGEYGRGYSIVALGVDGRVYKYLHGDSGWKVYPSKLLGEV